MVLLTSAVLAVDLKFVPGEDAEMDSKGQLTSDGSIDVHLENGLCAFT